MRIKLPRSKRRLDVLTRKLVAATRSDLYAVKRLKVLLRDGVKRKQAADRRLEVRFQRLQAEAGRLL